MLQNILLSFFFLSISYFSKKCACLFLVGGGAQIDYTNTQIHILYIYIYIYI